ncbi:MAG: hypothetical protein ACXVMN_05505 [Flavisolibacter sp.]
MKKIFSKVKLFVLVQKTVKKALVGKDCCGSNNGNHQSVII